MVRRSKMLVAVGLLAAVSLVGCSATYSNPDPSETTEGDVGLQSKDVMAATSQMVSDLLALPSLNASPTQWTITVDHFQDETIDRLLATNYDIFSESLKSAISQKARGRITLIESAATFDALRAREVGGSPDPYQQGGGDVGPAGALNPDYILYGKAIDMPNRSTNYYMIQYNIFNTHTRVVEWSRTYNVKTNR